MISEEVREFSLSPTNTLFSKGPKELGYSAFNVDETLEFVDKWADSVKANVDLEALSLDEAFEYIKKFEEQEDTKKLLEELAIKAVETALGFRFEDLKLRDIPVKPKTELTPNNKFQMPREEKEEEEELPVFDEEFRVHSNRRRILHGITACAGLSAGTNLHKLVTQELNEIDPMLVKCYDIIGLTSLEQTYAMNPLATYMMYKQAEEGNLPIQNSCEVDMEEDEEGERTLGVKAEAITFNLLLHETFKGVLNLYMMLNIPQELFTNKGSLKAFYKESDSLVEEYFHFLSSMHLYKEFVQFCINRDLAIINVFEELNVCEPRRTIQFLMSFHKLDPEEADYIYDRFISDSKDQYDEDN